MKRSCASTHPESKRRALRQIQLETPPTTPEKDSVIDLQKHIAGHGKKLLFSLSVYTKTKALFQRGSRSSSGEYLVGREREAAAFSTFLRDSISARKCASLYVSGPPGTGKTAQVNLTLDTLCLKENTPVHLIYGSRVLVMRVNCMAVSKPEHIFHEIHSHIAGPSGRKKSFDDVYAALRDGANGTDTLVVVLDEMDCLITKDQQVLFQLFHCASHMKTSVLTTKLVLVGISNALDLTDKFLPRLRSNGFDPEAIQFMPYTGDQIRNVITSKLQSLVEDDKENSPMLPLMHPAAIMLCCKKCAAVTGDLRKAFDICTKSLDVVEKEALKSESQDWSVHTAPKVMISHVAMVCASTFGDNSLAKVQNLNVLQKTALCSLFKAEYEKEKSFTVNELYDYYCKNTLCEVESLLGRLKKGEFLEIVSALESTSTVVLTARLKTCNMHVDVGNKVIRPNVPVGDLKKAVDSVGVLRRILASI